MHFTVAAAVLACGMLLRVSLIEWCVLLLCIGMVFTAELFNSALEMLAKAVDRRHNPRLGAALDIAAGAVLVASITAATVGSVVFLFRLGVVLGCWKATAMLP